MHRDRLKKFVDAQTQETNRKMRQIFPENPSRECPGFEEFLKAILNEEEIHLGSLDGITFPEGVERKVLRNYALKTKDTFDYPPFQIPRYALSDKGVQVVSDFLGCIPLESERCYSIIRFLAERSTQERTPLGFSRSDMQELIWWMIHPTYRRMFG